MFLKGQKIKILSSKEFPDGLLIEFSDGSNYVLKAGTILILNICFLSDDGIIYCAFNGLSFYIQIHINMKPVKDMSEKEIINWRPSK